MRIKNLIFILLLINGLVSLAQYPPDTIWEPQAPYTLQMPPYLTIVHDADRSIDMTRISDATAFGVPEGAGALRHPYAKIQAWNSDMSKLCIGYTRILDASDYSLTKSLVYPGGYFTDGRWSNTNPDIRYFCWNDNLLKINVVTDQIDTLHQFTGYNATIGPYEGNISQDDKYVVITNDTLISGHWHGNRATLFDLQADTIVSSRYFGGTGFDWASITPWNDYIAVSNNETGKTELYDLYFNFVKVLIDNQQHADFAIDANGDEVIVQVIPLSMTRLSDNHFTDLLRDATVCGWEHENPNISGHVSGRNFNYPGWAYISVPVTACGNGNGYYYATEIFAIKLDTTETIKHFGYSRSSHVAPGSTTVASVSPDGTKVIYNSDWNMYGNYSDYVHAYVSTFKEKHNYYISVSGNDTNPGTESLPWKTIDKVVNKMSNFSAGDSILFKRGDAWNGTCISTSNHPSGTINNPIVYAAYGTGNRPVINIHVVQSPVWTDEGSNIWSAVIAGGSRFFKNGVELLRANDSSFLGLYGTEYFTKLINNGNNQKLKIYSIANPNTNDYYWSNNSATFALYDADYICLEEIDFQGGASSSIRIYDNENWLIKNCTAGKNAGKAIKIKNSNNIEITGCHFDANNTVNQSQLPPNSPIVDYTGCDDGIFVTTGSSYVSVSNCYFKNWGHASFSANTNDPNNIVSHVKFYNNELTTPDLLWGGRVAYSGYSEDGEYYNNYIHDISVQNQLGGSRNHFHHNIIDRVLDSPLKTDKIGVGIKLSNYNVQVKDNIIENNVVANAESEGILIYSINFKLPGEVSGNIIRNNIIYNCGEKTDGIGIQLHEDSIGQKIFNNLMENNLIFNDTTTRTCRYQYNGTICDVATFNTLSSKIQNNIGIDPLFADTANNNFHLQGGSPCIDAGKTGNSNRDYDNNPIPLLANPDIGAYEYGIYWKGVLSNDWHTAGNWSNQAIPTITDSITIPSPEFYHNYPIVNSNSTVKKIFLNQNSVLHINNNFTITNRVE
jgi:hypothetical protein